VQTQDKILKTAKAHQRYRVNDKVVPSVTAILGLLNKPALVKWANNLGLQGIDSNKYVDEAAKIGSLVHDRIDKYLTGGEVDLNDYSPNQVSQSNIGFAKFMEWYEKNDVEVIATEEQLTSEVHEYGGTLDCYANVNGVPTLLDFKTGKAIYEEYFVQLIAYVNMLMEQGRQVEQVVLLRIGRSEDEGFETRTIQVDSLWKHWDIFLALLKVYKLKKEIGWN
jgi:hypothetical protein